MMYLQKANLNEGMIPDTWVGEKVGLEPLTTRDQLRPLSYILVGTPSLSLTTRPVLAPPNSLNSDFGTTFQKPKIAPLQVEVEVVGCADMADAIPQKRVLPARDRRESAVKRRASSPAQPPTFTPAARKPSTPVPSSEPRVKRKYTKRASLANAHTSRSRSSPSASLADDVLPTRLATNKPLPTLKEKQPKGLSLDEYQSIAESAILSASLHRSRMQWLFDGIFDKYWVKPVKRKGVIEAPPNNPDVKSMQKLGSATLTIEPHSFDAIFYTVRDPSAPQPAPRHINQNSGKTAIPPPPPYGMHPPSGPHQHPRPHGPFPPPSQTSGPAPATHTVSPAPAPTPATPLPPAPPPPPPQAPQTPETAACAGPVTNPVKQEEIPKPATVPPSPSRTPSSAPSPKESPQTARPNQRLPNPPPGGRGSTTDPVIQMLAARAASDPQLKELMKVVATSMASPEQLKEFQAHIDEFNEIVRRQEADRVARSESQASNLSPPIQTPPASLEGPREAKPESNPATPKPATPKPAIPAQVPKSSTPAAAHPSTYKATQTQPRPHPPPPGPGGFPGVMHTFPLPSPSLGAGGPRSGYGGYQQPPLPPPPRPEPIIRHIVLEMTSTSSGSQSACQDRWLFPVYAVLEIRYGGLEMVCSFFVERRGSDILASTGTEPIGEVTDGTQPRWKADQDYYQPVTMTIKAMNHRTIETIARAAKPLPAVQEYMKEVMKKKERTPVEYLVHQVPRDRGHVGSEGTEGFVDSGVELGSESCAEDDELKAVYGI